MLREGVSFALAPMERARSKSPLRKLKVRHGSERAPLAARDVPTGLLAVVLFACMLCARISIADLFGGALLDVQHPNMHRCWEALIFSMSAAVAVCFAGSPAHRRLQDLHGRHAMCAHSTPWRRRFSPIPEPVGHVMALMFAAQTVAGWFHAHRNGWDFVGFTAHLVFYVPVWATHVIYLRSMAMLLATIKDEIANARHDAPAKLLQRRVVLKEISRAARDMQKWWSFFVCYGSLGILVYTRKALDSQAASEFSVWGVPLHRHSYGRYILWGYTSITNSPSTLEAFVQACRIVQPLLLIFGMLYAPTMLAEAHADLLRACETRADKSHSHTQAVPFELHRLFAGRLRLAPKFALDLHFTPVSDDFSITLQRVGFFILFIGDKLWGDGDETTLSTW